MRLHRRAGSAAATEAVEKLRASYTQLKLGVNEKGVQTPMRAHTYSTENSE
jgi:hypothetical protein